LESGNGPESVGSYEAANLVVQQSKRQRFLEDNAAGVSKGKGGRDPTLPDVDRRTMTEGLLLRAVTGEELKKHIPRFPVDDGAVSG